MHPISQSLETYLHFLDAAVKGISGLMCSTHGTAHVVVAALTNVSATHATGMYMVRKGVQLITVWLPVNDAQAVYSPQIDQKGTHGFLQADPLLSNPG